MEGGREESGRPRLMQCKLDPVVLCFVCCIQSRGPRATSGRS